MNGREFVPTQERVKVFAAVVELRADLERALKQLLDADIISPFDLLVLTLWTDGWALEQIANELDCSIGLAHKCLHRGLDGIRDSGLMQGYD